MLFTGPPTKVTTTTDTMVLTTSWQNVTKNELKQGIWFYDTKSQTLWIGVQVGQGIITKYI